MTGVRFHGRRLGSGGGGVFEVGCEIVGHEFVEVRRSTGALMDGVVAVGVGHERELLVVFDEFVDEFFGPLVVDVVVTRAVDDEKVAFEVGGVCDG